MQNLGTYPRGEGFLMTVFHNGRPREGGWSSGIGNTEEQYQAFAVLVFVLLLRLSVSPSQAPHPFCASLWPRETGGSCLWWSSTAPSEGNESQLLGTALIAGAAAASPARRVCLEIVQPGRNGRRSPDERAGGTDAVNQLSSIGSGVEALTASPRTQGRTGACLCWDPCLGST
eukprot:2888613-Rhodomonas_salina.1